MPMLDRPVACFVLLLSWSAHANPAAGPSTAPKESAAPVQSGALKKTRPTLESLQKSPLLQNALDPKKTRLSEVLGVLFGAVGPKGTEPLGLTINGAGEATGVVGLSKREQKMLAPLAKTLLRRLGAERLRIMRGTDGPNIAMAVERQKSGRVHKALLVVDPRSPQRFEFATHDLISQDSTERSRATQPGSWYMSIRARDGRRASTWHEGRILKTSRESPTLRTAIAVELDKKGKVTSVRHEIYQEPLGDIVKTYRPSKVRRAPSVTFGRALRLARYPRLPRPQPVRHR